MLNKWVSFFKDIGITASKWTLPKGSKKEIVPAPYVVLQKKVDKIIYADNEPYQIVVQIFIISVTEPDDEKTERLIESTLWDKGISFEPGEETYDSTMGAHIREFLVYESMTYADYLRG